MSSKKILIVEDDESILRLETDYLEANGFTVDAAKDGTAGLKMALEGNYNLIMLDIMLPGVSGLEICKRVRKESNIPILLVSAKKDDFDKIKGLGFGADDYIVKPFSPSELTARVIAHINRYERLTAQHEEKSKIIEIGTLTIDTVARRVYVKGEEVIMTNKEFDLLTCLAEKPDRIFSKDELFEKIWKYDSMGETSTVTVHVNRIRDKIFAVDKEFKFINTVWGRGYRFNK
ncbi:MAG: response regulator transcription factor [Ruminococcaceae bacterium]|nr:response regulator transcription factor [Oscillospiraceae bacterium]